MSSDDRTRRYAEAIRNPGAFVERNRVEHCYFGSARAAWETLPDWQTRAVMAVADAEQAGLRADRDRLAAENVLLPDQIAELRAKTARVEALAESMIWKRPEKCPCEAPEACCGSANSCDRMQPSVSVIGYATIRAALDGPAEA